VPTMVSVLRSNRTAIAGPYHYDSSVMQIDIAQHSPTAFTVTCEMYGAPCPGRPGATGDGGNWTAAHGTVLGGVLSASFNYHATVGGWNDTGKVKLNSGGGSPTLSWKQAGTWNPGHMQPPPPPSPSPMHGYSVEVTERNVAPVGGGAVISRANASSDFTYNFNAAYFPAPSSGGADGLAIRVLNAINKTDSGIAVVRRLGGPQSMTFEHVHGGKDQMILTCSHPPTADSPCADDPRMVYRPKTGTYYMTYDNTSGLDKNLSGRVTWIASSQQPWVPSNWSFHGPVAPEFKKTAGVSLLLRDDVPGSLHYAFIGNRDTAGSLYSATSADLITWHVNHTAFQGGRPGYFDHGGIAAGPQVERLSDGSYLMLYNIDNAHNCQSASCGPCGVNCSANTGCHFCRDGRCALGWMILDGDDPLRVIARAVETLLYAELPFETVGSHDFPTQTPWVIFSDGLQKVGTDEFVVWYGAGDSNTAAARIKVTVPGVLKMKSDDATGTIAPHTAAGTSTKLPSECQPKYGAHQHQPQYHIIAPMEPGLNGTSWPAGLNDANAVYQHKGHWHIMHQCDGARNGFKMPCGGGHEGPQTQNPAEQTYWHSWGHVTSHDGVSWRRVTDVLTPTITGIDHDRGSEGDGSVSFPQGQDSAVLLYSAAAGYNFPHGLPMVTGIARPNNASMLQWTKHKPLTYANGSAPCFLAGRVWQSADKSHYNMVCITGGLRPPYSSTIPDARYSTENSSLEGPWTLADARFACPVNTSEGCLRGDSGPPMFEQLPHPQGDEPTHILSNSGGGDFSVGTLDAATEKFIPRGGGSSFDTDVGALAFSAAGLADDGRVLFVGWVGAGADPQPCAPPCLTDLYSLCITTHLS
jgi:predicted GH43/DUF377 family glycosyl hydrolase